MEVLKYLSKYMTYFLYQSTTDIFNLKFVLTNFYTMKLKSKILHWSN